MFKTPSVSYSFTFEYLRLSSKHSFTFYWLSLARSNLKVSIVTKTPQPQSCCLDWRASSSRDLNCAWVSHYATGLPGGDVPLANTISPAWSRTHAAVLHFLSWITQGVSHTSSASPSCFSIYFPSYLLTQSKHQTIHSQPTAHSASFSELGMKDLHNAPINKAFQ